MQKYSKFGSSYHLKMQLKKRYDFISQSSLLHYVLNIFFIHKIISLARSGTSYVYVFPSRQKTVWRPTWMFNSQLTKSTTHEKVQLHNGVWRQISSISISLIFVQLRAEYRKSKTTPTRFAIFAEPAAPALVRRCIKCDLIVAEQKKAKKFISHALSKIFFVLGLFRQVSSFYNHCLELNFSV